MILAVFAGGAALWAAAPSRPEDPTRAARHAEAALIERRLSEIEARVLETDAVLRRINQVVNADLLAAMGDISPGIAADVRRLGVLRARPGGEAHPEARRLEARIDAVREVALRDGRLAEMTAAFHDLLRDRMIQVDPDALFLLRRYGELLGTAPADAPAMDLLPGSRPRGISASGEHTLSGRKTT